MRILSKLLTLLLLGVAALPALAAEGEKEPGTDSLDVEVRRVMEADSLLVAGAGVSPGVGIGTKAVVYVPFYYLNARHKNRVARGLVVSTTDSTCQVRMTAMSAPVRPGYRTLLYEIQHPVIPPTAEVRRKPVGEKKPFYKRKWFWPAVGTAVAAAIIITVGNKASSPNQGTVSISGTLP